MLSDNIRVLRKNNGMTQEELALRLNVVRQTISKWEKGLSVPDAEMLQKLAEVLGTSVEKLLDALPEPEKAADPVAEQLARVNEQLVVINCRRRRIWIAVAATLVLVGLLWITNLALGVYYSFNPRVECEVITFETVEEIDP